MPGKWSIKEIVCHLWRVQDVFEKRIEAMPAHNGAAVESYNPESDAQFGVLAARPGSEIVDCFRRDCERFAAWLGALTEEQWQLKGAHPEYAHYDVAFQIEYMVHHEAHHLTRSFSGARFSDPCRNNDPR